VSRPRNDSSFVSRVRLKLQRHSLAHKPLSWLRRVALPPVRKCFAFLFYEFLRRLFFFSHRFGPALGWYSAYDLLRRGDTAVEGRIVLEGQGSPVASSDSVLVLCGRNQHVEQPWPVFWSRHRSVRLVGSSLVHISEQKQLCVEAAYGPARVTRDPAYSYCGTRSPSRLEGPWTSLVSKWVPTDIASPYAHWLLEALPRLALLREFPAGTRILAPHHGLPYQVESLQLLGLLDRCRWTKDTHIWVEDYYYSAQPSMIVCHNPYAIDFLRSTFMPLTKSAPITPPRFFVRRTSYWRNIVNEEEVLAFFEKAGWQVIDTASIAFREQVQLFAKAEAVCGIHGSGLANIAWCPRGCKVIELFADRYLAGDQEWISQCIGAEYHSLIFPSDYKLCARVDMARLRQLLSSLRLV
jgi:Glycosyltransferase 61